MRNHNFRNAVLGSLLLAGLVCAPLFAHAQPSLKEARRAQCPDGDYSGPGTGMRTFLQDPYVWFVSREFAKRFCMPESYIDDRLKGALALAVRIKPSEFKLCGRWMGRSDQCSAENRLLIDVYVDNKTANIPKYDPTVKYYSGPVDNSGDLVSATTGRANRRHKGELTEHPGEINPFRPLATNQIRPEKVSTNFKLLNVREGVADSSAPFFVEYYRADWAPSVDLITLNPTMILGYGRFNSPQPLDTTNPSKGYAIGVIRAQDEKAIQIPVWPDRGGAYRLPYPHPFITHVIELPPKVIEIFVAFDKKEGEKFFGDIKKSMQPKDAPNSSSER